MGAICNNQSRNNASNSQYIAGFQTTMEKSAQNQVLLNNLKNYSKDAPNKQFAILSNSKPKLLDIVQKSMKQQLTLSTFCNSLDPLKFSQNRGVNLPTFFIKDIDIFYEGEWMHGFPNGYGKIYYNNGAYYEGSIVDGQPSGIDGIFIYPNGSYKRGQFDQGCLSGQGKFSFKQRNFTYEGQWLLDQPHGKGIQRYSDGSTYQGRFNHGVKQDVCGVYTWPNGKTFKGEFRQGYMNGHGKIEMKNGKGFYQGQFQRNMIVGSKKIKTQYGQYQGDFQFGQINGLGKFKWNDGKQYEGSFQDGQLHGKGIIKLTNGQIFQGQWDRGKNVKLNKIN